MDTEVATDVAEPDHLRAARKLRERKQQIETEVQGLQAQRQDVL